VLIAATEIIQPADAGEVVQVLDVIVDLRGGRAGAEGTKGGNGDLRRIPTVVVVGVCA